MSRPTVAEYYTYRALEQELNVALRRRQRANDKIAAVSAQLRRAQLHTRIRLGLTDVQTDRLTPLILDVLERISVDGDCWIWTGARNNKGLPRMRDTRQSPPPEKSACVLLDEMLNDSDGTGIRYPNCRSGTACVNPAHKKIRGAGRQFQGVGAFNGGDEWAAEQERQSA